MSRARGMVLVAVAVLVTGCSGAARTGGAPGPPAVEDPVVPTASVPPAAVPTASVSPAAVPTAPVPTAGRPSRAGGGPTTSAVRGGPARTSGPQAVAPRTTAPPPPPPGAPSTRAQPATRPGGAPQGAAVIDQVDSGLDYDGFRQAQLANCTAEGQALGCWRFVLVGNAGDRVCAVSPPSRTVVPYGRTITITTWPVPEDMTCADYEAARATAAPGG